ncbi:MAG TPA: hypothetical protein VHA74_03445 [Candidatus Dojkabacteria bacterium]|nr:hypothetical protein [Candidatus Dojkabacteria bacterium]
MSSGELRVEDFVSLIPFGTVIDKDGEERPNEILVWVSYGTLIVPIVISIVNWSASIGHPDSEN